MMNKSRILLPCPHVAIVAIHADEVDKFNRWLDETVIEVVRANNRYARPDQIAEFIARVESIKHEVEALSAHFADISS